MLDRLDEDIDETNKNMMALDSDLKKLMAKPNICCLWIIILLELGGLVALILTKFG